MENIVKIIIFTLCCLSSYAQSNLKGILLDKDKQPIPLANVVLLSLPDSALVKGAISGDDGVFELVSSSNHKNMALKILHLEYKTKVIPLKTNDLGTIILEKSVNELGEVVVSVSRPIMKQQGTKIVTNIAQSTLKDLPQLSMVIDFLPGVSQSVFGEVEVFGKRNPVFYINNRRVRDMVDLMKISPQEIENIEIETQPGAEYDNSIGAIIRIKLKKKQGDGLGGILGFQSDFKRGFRGHIAMSLNYRVGKTDFFVLAQPEMENELFQENSQELLVKTASQNWQVNSKNTQKANGKHLFAKTGFTHEFNDKHSIGASFTSVVRPMSGHTFAEQETETFQNNGLLSKGKNMYDQFNQSKGLGINTYYEGKLSEKLKLQTDFDYKGTRSDNTSDVLEKNILTPSEKKIKTHSDAKLDWISIRTTLSQKVGKGGLSYGFEGSKLSRNEQYNDNVQITPYIENKETKSALFASYAFPWGKMNLKTGLRYEYTDFGYFENNQKSDVKSQTYRNLLPNFSLSFPWDKTQWSLSYVKRIRRPAFYELSDYSAYSSPFLYNRGNPNLVPTLTDELSLLTTYKNYSLAVEYSYIKNSIYEDYRLSDFNPNVVEKTIRNFDDFQKLKLTFSAYYKIGIWRPKATFSLIKQFGEGVFEQNKPIFSAGIDSQLMFSQKWMGLLNMNYYSKGSNANTYYYSNRGNIDFLLVRTFPKYSIQLFAGVTDILNSNKNYTEIRNPFITNRSFVIKNNSRTFTVALLYQFNPTQSKYKGQGENESEKGRL